MTANRSPHDDSGARFRAVCDCGRATHETGCHWMIAKDWAREHAERCEAAQDGGISVRLQKA